MTLKEFFKKTYPHEKEGFSKSLHLRPRIYCEDGFNLSVQANEGAYCAPRRIMEDPDETYYAAEIGYPSEVEPLIIYYAEDINSNLIDTIYPYVPTDLIEQVLEKHGGIDEERTFKPKEESK